MLIKVKTGQVRKSMKNPNPGAIIYVPAEYHDDDAGVVGGGSYLVLMCMKC